MVIQNERNFTGFKRTSDHVIESSMRPKILRRPHISQWLLVGFKDENVMSQELNLNRNRGFRRGYSIPEENYLLIYGETVEAT